MPKTTLLPLLASGEYRSGQDLAAALGVSRTAVWKQLNNLAELGLEIESVKGRGYRIPGGIDLLDDAAVRSGLGPGAAPLLTRLELLETVDSTNAQALRQIELGAGAGYVCCAEQQSAGRGRRRSPSTARLISSRPMASSTRSKAATPSSRAATPTMAIPPPC